MRIHFAFILLLLAGCGSAPIVEFGPMPEIIFCAMQDCPSALARIMDNSSSVACAFYSLRSKTVEAALSRADARVVIDHGVIGGARAKKATAERGLMHNKFCVMDDIVWTGSWNPSDSSNMADNIIVVRSEHLADMFLAEFEELWSGILRGGTRTSRNQVEVGNLSITAAFCPEDMCGTKAAREIDRAEHTIHAMLYSFTDFRIAGILRNKLARGINVSIVMDSAQSKKKEAQMVEGVMAPRKSVHHKVFIIDKTTVLIGSYNPTRAGDTLNDENLLIIHDPDIASLYEQEYERLVATK